MIQDMHLIRQIRIVQEYAYRLIMKSMKKKVVLILQQGVCKDKDHMFLCIDRWLTVYLY